MQKEAGNPLPRMSREILEPLFGMDFGEVRIHTSAAAHGMAEPLQASAFSLGPHIGFRRNSFSPDSGAGLGLIAHELAHVVQWRNAGRPSPEPNAMHTHRSVPETSGIEREAALAAESLMSGKTPVIRQAAPRGIPLRHPVYISRHGNQGFLNLAANFYRRWGYAPITTGVDSVQQIVADLAGKASIGRVTIVSHAHPTQLFLSLFNGQRAGITKDDWNIDTPEELIDMETHAVDEPTLDNLIRDLQRDADASRIMQRMGSPQDPIFRQFLWWALELGFVEGSNFSRQQKRRLRRVARRNMNRYRDLMLLALASVGGFGGNIPSFSERDFDRLREAILRITSGWNWPRIPRRQRARIERQLTRSPSGVISQVLLSSFFSDLETVRRKMSNDSWIEIQGCRVGQDRDYLLQMRNFFSSTRISPQVSGPDWFQFFGHYGFTPVQNNRRAIQLQWRRRAVREAFQYWYPILTGQPAPLNPTWEDFRDFLRTPHALPMAHPNVRGTQGQTLRVLFLAGQGEAAFLRWLSRHSYRLTALDDLRDALFTRRTLSANINNSVVDWLQENRAGRTRRLFRPDPEYQNHIIRV